MQGISWLAVIQFASQEGLCSMELVSKYYAMTLVVAVVCDVCLLWNSFSVAGVGSVAGTTERNWR